MGRFTMLLCAVALASCSTLLRPGEDLPGNWVTVRVAGYDALPASCLRTGLLLREDGTFLDYSGEARISGTYAWETRTPGYLLTLTMTSHNSQPNCQGVLPQVSYRDPVRRYAAEVSGDEMKLHPPGQPSLWFVAVRSAGPVD